MPWWNKAKAHQKYKWICRNFVVAVFSNWLLCCIFKKKLNISLVSFVEIDDIFTVAQVWVVIYSTPCRLDRACKWGGLLLHVREEYLRSKLN